jgi:hypothetical protein
LHLGQPYHGGGKGEEGAEGGESFFASHGDSAEALDLVDEAFDEMALLVEIAIVRDGAGSGGIAWDHGDRADVVGDERAKGVGIIGGVGDDETSRAASQKVLGAPAFMNLPAREDEAGGIAEGIDPDVDPSRTLGSALLRRRIIGSADDGRQAAARAAERVSLSPPFAPSTAALLTILMDPHDGGIDDRVFKVRLISQGIDKTLPDTFARPSVKAAAGGVPAAALVGEVAPRRAGPRQP